MILTESQVMDLLASTLYKFMNETNFSPSNLQLVHEGVTVLNVYEEMRVKNGRGTSQK